MKVIDAKDIVEVIKNTKKITLPKSKSIKLSKLLTTSTSDSEDEEILKELEGEYDISGFHIRNKQTHTNLINTIRKSLSDKDRIIAQIRFTSNEMLLEYGECASKLKVLEEYFTKYIPLERLDKWNKILGDEKNE